MVNKGKDILGEEESNGFKYRRKKETREGGGRDEVPLTRRGIRLKNLT